MKELGKQLLDLQAKIDRTWQMLRLDERSVELRGYEAQMQAADFWSRPEEAKRVSRVHEALRQEIQTWTALKQEVAELFGLSQELEERPDEDMSSAIVKRLAELETEFARLEFWLLMDGKYDTNNAIVGIHAGSGGTEAQDWAEMLLRMILRFAEKKGWQAAILDETRGAEAGIKSVTMRIEGRYAFGYLKSEHGTHRLVRISPFDAEKMRHTSFAGIEVIPEIESADAVTLDPKDLRIDTFMAGGHGGQSVNTTYSAVRIVHIPTGITVQCQNERSQMQNKEVALRVLQSRLQQLQIEQEAKERQELRGEYKSAEWGNQIRSYVLHPYKLVKDVRTKFETTDPEAVLNGELGSLIEAYLKWIKSRKH